jgi:tRNA pseudouridine38-40 synthase
MNNKTGNSNNKRNIKLILEYDGSGYAGWQRLGVFTGKRSIQSVLEECLSTYFQEDIKVIGSGRTDAGVHALGQVANFHCVSKQSVGKMKTELNVLLPDDIKVNQVAEAEKEFHSRYLPKPKPMNIVLIRVKSSLYSPEDILAIYRDTLIWMS